MTASDNSGGRRQEGTDRIGSKESRLAEAEKQIRIVREQLQEDAGEVSQGSHGFSTTIELPELYDSDTEYSLQEYPNDPAAQVALSLSGRFGSVRIEMSSDRATQLGDDLREAARGDHSA